MTEQELYEKYISDRKILGAPSWEELPSDDPIRFYIAEHLREDSDTEDAEQE